MKYGPPLVLATAGVLACAFTTPPPAHATRKPHKHIPTYAQDVAPILYAKCTVCHHAGEVAPFTLTSYADAKSKAKTIAVIVSKKYMPPWQADSHGEFLNERTLTSEQISTLQAWADAGAPAGDLHEAPKPPSFTPGWQMGTPDFIGAADRPYPITADGPDDYRCFIIPTHYDEDRFVTGVEVRPGNRKVVHHVLLYLDTHGAARNIRSNDGKPGYPSFGGPGFVPSGSLGGWAPGLQPALLSEGNGFLLPKGADIVLQLHYHKDGKAEIDLTSIGLKFASAPVDKRVRWEAIGDELLDIPAGDSHYAVHASLRVPRNVTVLDVIPHMHWLGHDMTVTATLPDGTKKTLIDVDRYDFNWQTRYTYKAPVRLPAGTELSLIAHYDNSSDNPRNPNDPPKPVTFGEQTTNEMCFAFFSYTLDGEHLRKGVRVTEEDAFQESDATLGRIFDRFDANHDCYMDATELAALIRYFSGDPEPTDGKPDKAASSAKLGIVFFGKAHKGMLTKEEFMKMVRSKDQ